MKETVMKKVISVVVSLMMVLMLSGVALSAQPAKAKTQHLKQSELTSGFYVAAQGGLAFLTDSDVSGSKSASIGFDPGYALGVAVGKRIDKTGFRVEGEIGYQENEVDSKSGGGCCKHYCTTGEMKAYSFLVNGYYDIVHGKKFVPYITAGIGAAKVDADVNHIAHVDDIGLAYQVGVGLAYHISDNWHIDMKYRYFGVADVDGFGLDNTNPGFATNNVFLGLRYRF
jgi:OmpA-OmpF porin, OOP family